MKIIFLEAVQNFGGSKRSVIEIANHLKNIGHEILIVDFWGANKEFKEAAKINNLAFNVLEPTNELFVIAKGSPSQRIPRLLKYFYKRIIYKKKFQEITRNFKPDYVCVNSFKTLDILSSNSNYKIDYYARGWNIGDNIKTKILLRKYSPRFIAISESTRHAIFLQNKIPLDSIRILKVTVGEESFKKPQQDKNLFFCNENPIILFTAGTFIKSKGHHISILIAKALKEKGIYFKMRIAGLITMSVESKNYYNYLKEMIDNLDLKNEVTLIVNNHNLNDEIEKIHILIYPSFTEGLSRICLEAMAKGKPVIANPVGGITDFVISGYSGYLARFNDIENYVDNICQYYKNTSLYQQHCSRAIDIINSGYLLKNINENLKKIYNPNNV